MKTNAIEFVLCSAVIAIIAAGCASSAPNKNVTASPPPPSPSEEVSSAPAAQQQQPIHPETDRLLRAASATLAGAKYMSFKAEMWDEELVDTHKIAATKHMQLQVRHPDGLQMEWQSPKRTRGWWYDGKSITMLDRLTNLYAMGDMPDTIEEGLDALTDDYGVTLPLDDLLLADPYASIMSAITGGAYFGKLTTLGVACHHIGYSTANVDVQLWVEDNARALPRKIVITYKLEEAQPQFTAILSDWVLDKDIPDGVFAFIPPAGSAKIEMLPAKTDQ